MTQGERLIVVVGPSGAGKDSVLRAWRHALPHGAPVHFARRVITRPPDPQGEGHESIDEAGFSRLSALDDLAVEWRAHGLRYGVRKRELAPLGEAGWVVMNGSRAHLPVMRFEFPRLRVVEIAARPELLRERIAARGREGAAAAAERLARSVPAVRADLVVCNDGAIGAAVDTLSRWWSRLGAATP